MTPAAPGIEPAVLVVEDEAMIALMVEDMLAEGGYRSAWSPDGRGVRGACQASPTLPFKPAGVIQSAGCSPAPCMMTRPPSGAGSTRKLQR